MAAFSVDRFKGLNLVSDPQEVGPEGASDMLDVDLDQQGRLRTRDGYGPLTAAQGTNRYDSLAFFDDTLFIPGQQMILAGAGNRLESLDSSGNVLHSSTAPTASPHYFTVINETTFIANGTDQIRAADVSGNFTSPASLAAQTGKHLAQWETRMVNASSVAFPSRVWFSDAGDPLTFATDNWVDITPGDGEPITALIAWNGMLFAFKRTKYAVFYGVSEDTTGGAIFNYRMVDTGVGCTGGKALCPSPYGVFFVAFDGLYLTSGGPPSYQSAALEPLFRFSSPAGYSGSYINAVGGAGQLAFRENRVYMSVATGASTTQNRVFVLNIRDQDWVVWSVPMAALLTATLANTQRQSLFFAYATGLKHVATLGGTNDAGSAIPWFYQSGSYDMGQPDNQKTVRSTSLWGSGTVTLQMGADMAAADTGGPVTLGTAPAIARGEQSIDRSGYLLSHRLSGTGAAVVHRLVHKVRGARGEDVS
jgi:hypothetical protein